MECIRFCFADSAACCSYNFSFTWRNCLADGHGPRSKSHQWVVNLPTNQNGIPLVLTHGLRYFSQVKGGGSPCCFSFSLEWMHFWWQVSPRSQTVPKPDYLIGHGSKLKSWGYAGFSLWFHLPRCHFGTTFLSHSRFDVSSLLLTHRARGFYREGGPRTFARLLAGSKDMYLLQT